MTRAGKACSAPRCPHLLPCPDHTLAPWATSTRRRKHTTSGWEQQRRAKRVMRRYRGVCHVCGQAGADEVDHVDPNGPDDESNLRPIHSRPCHLDKTQAEATRARLARG